MKKKIFSKEQLQECLDLGLTREQIKERLNCSLPTLDRNMKEQGLSYLKNTYFYKGDRNPCKNPEVKRKIANTVKTLWEEGYYADRENGMTNVKEFNHPNYTGHKNTYREYLANYQDINVCSECGKTIEESKIDVHHIDENHTNWLVTNLQPLCVHCHRQKHLTQYKQPYVTIGVKSHFDSSHHLLNYVGKCAREHGHRYFYELKIKQRLNPVTGMVMDFKELKKIMKEFEEIVDHACLNDILPFNPTAENMIPWMFEYFSKTALVKGIVEISVWETPDCIATFTPQDMLDFYIDNKIDDLSDLKEVRE